MRAIGVRAPDIVLFSIILVSTVAAMLAWGRLSAIQQATPYESYLAALTVLVYALVDGVMFAALPRLGLSYGPVKSSLGIITVVRLLAMFTVVLPVLFGWVSFQQASRYTTSGITGVGTALFVIWLLDLVILGISVYGMYIEPFDLQTTRIQLTGPQISPGHPLRILHLTDLHVERITPREHEVIRLAKELQPDMILLTGDYANLDYLNDPHTLQDTRTVLSQLSAPYGVYAVTGSVDLPLVLKSIFDGLPITVLKDETRMLQVGSQQLYLVGVSNYGRERDAQALQTLMETVPLGAYTILLYHTPDLAEDAAQAGVNLYLAGHTHGGQIRLPVYGAIITMSYYGKKFESGLYHLGQMALYVSRGIGMEGLKLPRARLFCPPEIELFELESTSTP
jgi:uncharacterized protein